MIVAADLEGTLTGGETWRGIGRFLAQHGRAPAYRAFVLAHLPAALLARAGLADELAFRDRWTARFPRLLRGLSGDELRRLAGWVVDHELWPGRRAVVLAELEQYRRAGGRLVLASGTYQPVLDCFARRLGAEAIGTPLEIAAASGRVTGRLAEPVNTGATKAARLRAALAGAPLAVAYGDTLADLPMLELSAGPVVVGPDARLARLARARGWRILPVAG